MAFARSIRPSNQDGKSTRSKTWRLNCTLPTCSIKTSKMRKAVIDGFFYSPVVAASSFTVADRSTEHLTSDPSKASMAAPQSTENRPTTMASSQFERLPKRFHYIKRARVENITQGTLGSPKARLPGDGEGSHEGDRTFLPACKWRMSPSKNRSYRLGGTSSDNREEFSKLQQRLWATQSFLGELQSSQPSSSQDHHRGKAENYSPWSNRERDTEIPNRPDGTSQTSQDKEYEVSFRRDKMDSGQTSQEDNRNVKFPTGHAYLLETLKEELSQAVCQSVDLVFENIFPTLYYQSHQAHDARPASFPGYMKPRSETLMPSPPEPSGEREDRPHLELQENPKLQLAENQKEGLSLVTNNPAPLMYYPPGDPAGKKPSNSDQTQLPFNQQNSLQERQILDCTTSANSSCPCKIQAQDQVSHDTIPWSQIKEKANLNSASVGHTVPPAAPGQGPASNLCHPGAFLSTDMQVVGKRNLLMKEGLTPNHLKKAKLMFFYCRYPSTNVLRTSFPDIKFNRCITSQLVKWFSNFREFYYIQMEKASRQFVADGVSSASDLCVGRDSQLFRVLNTHFNRANDFQVPSRFLKVAEITLREFFNAISLAKDRDPSWKKVIYKVISKLDSDVPDVLKSPISW